METILEYFRLLLVETAYTCVLNCVHHSSSFSHNKFLAPLPGNEIRICVVLATWQFYFIFTLGFDLNFLGLVFDRLFCV